MYLNKTLFLQKYKSTLLEHSIGDLKDNSEINRKERSKFLYTYFDNISQDGNGQAKVLFKVPSQQTEGVVYDVNVVVIPEGLTLFQLAKQKWEAANIANALKNANVKLHCSCADFLYGGAAWNLGYGRYKGSLEPIKTGYKNEEITEPNIKDPDRKNILCKHCISVANRFSANGFMIFKAAKNFKGKVVPSDVDTEKTEPAKLKKDIELVNMDAKDVKEFTNNILEGVRKEAPSDPQVTPQEREEEIEVVTEKEVPEATKPEEVEVEEVDTEIQEEKVDSVLEPVDEKVVLEKDKPESEVDTEEVEEVLERPSKNDKDLI